MNSMVDFLVFLFGCIGITSIIVDGEIFKPIKDYIENKVPKFINTLLNCYQCSGFWVGIIFGVFLQYKYLNSFSDFAYLFLLGGLSSAASYFYALYLTYLEANSMVQFNDYSNENNNSDGGNN